MTVDEAQEIVKRAKELKILLVKAQDYYHGAQMRDIEKEYMNKKVETK
jgi:hypothetical protein